MSDLPSGSGGALEARILEGAPDAIVASGGDGRIVYANARAEVMLGYARGELIGQSVEILLPVALRSRHEAHRARFQAAPVPRLAAAGLGLVVRRKDGVELFADILLNPVGIDGQALIVATIHDLTEHRKLEDALRAREERLDALLAHSADATYLQAADGTILYASRSVEQVLGYTTAELVGRKPDDLIHPDDLERVNAEVVEVLGNPGRTYRTEFRVRHKDGTWRWLSGAATNLLSHPSVKAIVVNQHDISLIRESEARFRTLVASLEELVYTLDLDLRYTGFYARTTPEHRAYLGKTVREILGDPAATIHDAAYPKALAGQRVVFEWPVAASPGAREFQTSLAPLFSDGNQVIGLVGVVREITETKRMQAQLLTSDRMVSVGMLAAGVAHEINNPLAAVTLNLELAQRDVATFLGAHAGVDLGELEQELAEAREAADRVRQIVRDLKIFSRADDDTRANVDLQRVLDSSARMAWNEVRHRARIVKDYRRIPPVLANEGRLGQVFLNLIVNAAQAIPEGDAENNEIRLSTAVDGSGRVIVLVRDTGPGMPPEVLSRLFTPFFTTKPIGVGTGLGLSICQRIVSSIGGEIQVESQVGKGSQFKLLLPAAPEGDALRATKVNHISEPPLRRGRVLVVDDDVAMASAIRRTLVGSHDVTVETQAQKALDRLLAGERFDAILCDLMMPQMTGMDLHAAIVAAVPEQAERIVFLTGGAFTPRARQFLDDVPNHRLEKPFDPRALRALVADRVR